jgi:VIT1/CCC1 family predicted Fe2+/Mn2+ transporter
VSEDVMPKDEVRAAIKARGELGEEMEPAVVDAFVERIERRLAERTGQSEWALQRKREHQKEMVLGSMGIAIPLLAIAAVFAGLAGVVVVCVALVAIALVTAR